MPTADAQINCPEYECDTVGILKLAVAVWERVPGPCDTPPVSEASASLYVCRRSCVSRPLIY